MKRLTPLGRVIVAVLVIVAFAIGIGGAFTLAGEKLPSISSPVPTIAAVWFPENGSQPIQVGSVTVRLATIVGSERAIAVSCTEEFEPSLTQTYVADSYVLETEDGRVTTTFWVLRQPTQIVAPWKTRSNTKKVVIE